MADSSSRVLVDRSVLRLDGKPFFAFGPRVLLTPRSGFRDVLKDVAGLGFTVVGSPPCSPGTIDLVNAFFDEAEAQGLMVMLLADPRLPEHGRYLAENFSHRTGLLCYMLAPRPATQQGLDGYLRERDAIRAHDLFNPIFLPLHQNHFQPPWLRGQDLYAPTSPESPAGTARLANQQPARMVRELGAGLHGESARPVICADLRVGTGDEARAAGLYDDDPWVSRLPPRSLDWFPYMANYSRIPRRDMLGPDPEILRLQIYDLLATGTRGALLHFFECFGGPMPFSGRDRLCEAAILAQEIAMLHDFFAEGKPRRMELETGHPRLSAGTLQLGMEHLIVLRMEGYEEDFFIDEAYMERTELELKIGIDQNIQAWRVDFPEVKPLQIVHDSSGSIRFLAGPLELTGLVLLGLSARRAEEIAQDMKQRLPIVAPLASDLLEKRFAKIAFIEGELRSLGTGVDNTERLQHVQKGMEETKVLLQAGDFAAAYARARRSGRMLRQIVKYQMAKALSAPLYEGSRLRMQLRNSYYTLPRFYREVALETARAFDELT